MRDVGVGDARHPMLGGKDGLQAHGRGRRRDQIDGAAALGVDAGLVGHEADGLADEHRELLLDHRVQTGQDASAHRRR